MDNKKIIVFLFAITVCFAASTLFFYLDNASLKEQFAALSHDRDDAIAKLAAVNQEKQLLQARVNALLNNQDDDNTDSADKLAKLLQQKEQEFAALRQELEKARAATSTETPDRRGRSMQERMERMREEDPQRYEQMQAWRENMRKQMEERQLKRDAFLNNLKTARLTDAQREVINDYQAILQANQELAANAMNGDMESGREMWENQRAINELSESVRDILIEQTAGGKVAADIKTILDITSPGGPGGFGGRPGGGGR